MWVTQLNIADWCYSKTQTLLETWQIQNQLLVKSCVFSAVEQLVPIRLDTESVIISLDAGLRMHGISAVDLWDVVIEVLHSSNTNTPTTKNDSANKGRVKELRETAASTSNVTLRKEGNQDIEQVSNLDHGSPALIPVNVKHSCTFLKTTRQ